MTGAVFAVVTTLLSAQALADPVPEPWQSLREARFELTDKACSGDRGALDEVWDRVRNQNDPVLQSNLSWMAINCTGFTIAEEEQAKWQLRAVLQGYPIAMHGYAFRLIRGEGVPQDIETGVALAERAAAAGYGQAAADLAVYYAQGKYLPQDLAKAERFLDMAQQEGVEEAVMKRVRATVASASHQAAVDAAGPSGQTGRRTQAQPATEPSPSTAPSTATEASGDSIAMIGTVFPAKPKKMSKVWVNIAKEPNRHRNRPWSHISHGDQWVAGPFDHVNWLYGPGNIQTNDTRLFIAGMCNTDDPKNGIWVKIFVGMTLEVKKTFRGVCLLQSGLELGNGRTSFIVGKNLRDIRYDARKKKTYVTLDQVWLDGMTYERLQAMPTISMPLCGINPRVDNPPGKDTCFDS